MRYHITLVFESIADLKHFTQAMDLMEMSGQIKRNENTILAQQDIIAKNEEIIERAGIKPQTERRYL